MVVEFVIIKDTWLVWNHKNRIRYDKEAPIRIQEDLPKQLRESTRVMQRIPYVHSLWRVLHA